MKRTFLSAQTTNRILLASSRSSPMNLSQRNECHPEPIEQAGACEKQPTKSSDVKLPLLFGRRGAEPAEPPRARHRQDSTSRTCQVPATLLLPQTLHCAGVEYRSCRRGKINGVAGVVAPLWYRVSLVPPSAAWQPRPGTVAADPARRTRAPSYPKRKGNPDSNRSADGVAQGFA